MSTAVPGDVEPVSFASDGVDLYGRLRHVGDQAPTVIQLVGLGFHTFEYEPLAIQLAGHSLNSLSFDFRGHGRSGGHRGRWTLDDLAADTRHAIDFARQRDGGPIALFGNIGLSGRRTGQARGPHRRERFYRPQNGTHSRKLSHRSTPTTDCETTPRRAQVAHRDQSDAP